MTHEVPKGLLELVKGLAASAPRDYLPPSEGLKPASEHLLAFSHVKGTRGYIERVTNQVNGCYEKGWFDGCAVMMRRLLETLIIECFEKYQIAAKIQDSRTNEFLYLKDLIDCLVQEKSWNLGRNAKQALPKLKAIGDQSAHSRRFNATREDIDKIANDFRIVCQELLYLAQLK